MPLAEEARAWAKEEVRVYEEERVAVKWSLQEAGGSSKGEASWWPLFLSSSVSTGSPEVEERVASPPRSKGKGQVLI